MAGKLSKIINYRKVSESNKDFRLADYWLIEINTPKEVYFPGNDLIQIRTTSFSTGITDDPHILDKVIRGFTVKQGARPDSTAGQMQITMIDRVDQTLSYWIDSWKQALGNRDELSGIAKELYVSPIITATYFNINEVKIRTIEFYQCMIGQGQLQEDGAESPELEENLNISIDYEHFKRTFENTSL